VGEEAPELVDAPTVAFDVRGELVVLGPVGDAQHQLQGLLEVAVVFAETSAVPYQLLEATI
jgi:hypothetical protein